MIRLDNIEEFLEQGADLLYLFRGPLDTDRLPTRDDPRRKLLLNLLQIAVELAQEGGRFLVIPQGYLRTRQFDRISPPKRWVSVAPVIAIRTSSPIFIVSPVEIWVSMYPRV